MKSFLNFRFYSNFKQFREVQNSFKIVDKLTNAKINAKKISTSNFGTPCPTIPHNLPIKVLNEVIYFAYSYKKEKHELDF